MLQPMAAMGCSMPVPSGSAATATGLQDVISWMCKLPTQDYVCNASTLLRVYNNFTHIMYSALLPSALPTSLLAFHSPIHVLLRSTHS